MNKIGKSVSILIMLVLAAGLLPAAYASDEGTCTVYFTGIGCSHCAHTDPVVLDDLPKTTDIVVIEYEIFRASANSHVMNKYNDNYNMGFGVPQIIFSKETYLRGDTPILQKTAALIDELSGNKCPLYDGASASFDEIDITSLPGEPNIWKGERILMHSGGGGDAGLLKNLLVSESISSVVENTRYDIIEPEDVPLSGSHVMFENAIDIGGWIFQWNGEGLDSSGTGDGVPDPKENDTAIDNGTGADKNVKLSTVCLIALADTVNPCALAVFILMLIGITTYDMGNKKGKVIYAGLSFVGAVYIMYFFYGLIIIRSFQLVESITNIRPVLYTMLGFVSIILGLLHLKGYFWYKPGGLLTEMPISWRPRVKKLMTSITSPKGAFIMGAFVTLFLIPCTMGPYFIAGGYLSVLELMEAVPWLLIYCLVFILPLIGITFLIHFGFKRVEDVSGWKDRNIKKLHLIIAAIMLLIGAGIFLGFV